MAGRVLWIRVYPSFCPSILLSGSFLGSGSLVLFLKISIVLGAHVLLCVTEPDFLKKIFLLKKWGKWTKFIGKYSHFFFFFGFGI